MSSPPNQPSLEEQMMKQRSVAFEEELNALQKKHRLIIVPTLNQSMFGIMPDMIYMDEDIYNQRLQAGAVAANAQNPNLPKASPVAK